MHKACTSRATLDSAQKHPQKPPCTKSMVLVIMTASQHIQLLNPSRRHLRLQQKPGLGGGCTLQCDSNWDNSSLLPHPSIVLEIKNNFKKRTKNPTQAPQLKLTMGLYKSLLSRISPVHLVSFCLLFVNAADSR